MNKKYMFLLLGILLFTFFVSLVNVYAVTMPKDPGYDPNNITNQNVKTKANSIMGTFVFLVQVACIVTMIIMGLRYMFASAEAKADLKRSLITWCIGAVFVFGATTIVGLILNVATGEQYVTIKPMPKNEEASNKSEAEDDEENEKVVSDWATEYWKKAKEQGLVPSSIKNKPRATISRIEFTEAVYLIAQKFEINLDEPDGSIDVADQNLTRTKKNKILKLYNAGIVMGTGKDFDGNIIFESEARITREDVASVIYRLLQKSGKLKDTTISDSDMMENVYAEVSDYAKKAMVYMKKNSIMVGDENGNLNPKGNTTCEEAITILYRIYSGEE